MDFELTRTENDERLLPKLESITSAENIQVLIPFAKAYLGMFYVIDKALAEEEKVKLLANEELANAVLKGFLSSLKLRNLPTVEQIGSVLAEKKEFPEGYVILAGLDLIAKNSLQEIKLLELELLEKAVAFHFSNKTGYHNIWFDFLLSEQKSTVISAVLKYWVAMLKNNITYLPGKNLVLGDKPDVEITQYCILPLLINWKHCKTKTLIQLLHLAFKYSAADEFLSCCQQVLDNDENLNEQTRLYWLASAYLISPDKYIAKLSSYVGRVKLKIMPLLDFVILILSDKEKINITFSTQTITQLLRIIAPIFPPQHHVYGALGELDINSKNVMLMFYFLVCSDDAEVINELKLLRKARVMKIYSGVIDNLIEIHIRKKNDSKFELPDFNEYIRTLINNNCLQGRSNKFDLR